MQKPASLPRAITIRSFWNEENHHQDRGERREGGEGRGDLNHEIHEIHDNRHEMTMPGIIRTTNAHEWARMGRRERRERGDLNHEIHEIHDNRHEMTMPGIIRTTNAHECTRIGERGREEFKPRNTRNTRKKHEMTWAGMIQNHECTRMDEGRVGETTKRTRKPQPSHNLTA